MTYNVSCGRREASRLYITHHFVPPALVGVVTELHGHNLSLRETRSIASLHYTSFCTLSPFSCCHRIARSQPVLRETRSIASLHYTSFCTSRPPALVGVVTDKHYHQQALFRR